METTIYGDIYPMKLNVIIIKILFTLTALFSLFLWSCKDEDIIIDKPVNNYDPSQDPEMAMIPLSISFG